MKRKTKEKKYMNFEEYCNKDKFIDLADLRKPEFHDIFEKEKPIQITVEEKKCNCLSCKIKKCCKNSWLFKKNPYEEKYKSLTVDEQIKFESLSFRKSSAPFSWLLFPFWGSIWIALFVVLMNMAYGVDFKIWGGLVTMLLFKLWLPVLVILCFILLIFDLSAKINNRKLIDKILEERNK